MPIQYPIGIFSVSHVIFLIVLLPAAMVCAFFLAKKCGFSKTVIWVYSILGLMCEIERILFFLEEAPGGGMRPHPNHLPLNACPFQVILILILALSEKPQKHRVLLSFMYPMMVGGGFIGMLIPSAAVA